MFGYLVEAQLLLSFPHISYRCRFPQCDFCFDHASLFSCRKLLPLLEGFPPVWVLPCWGSSDCMLKVFPCLLHSVQGCFLVSYDLRCSLKLVFLLKALPCELRQNEQYVIHHRGSEDRNLRAVRFPLQEDFCGAFVSLKAGGKSAFVITLDNVCLSEVLKCSWSVRLWLKVLWLVFHSKKKPTLYLFWTSVQ